MREIDNIAAACGMRGFRYLRFAAPVIGAQLPAAALTTPEAVAEAIPTAITTAIPAALPLVLTQTPVPAAERAEAAPQPRAEPVAFAAPAIEPQPAVRVFALLTELAALSVAAPQPAAEAEPEPAAAGHRPIRSVAARRRAARTPPIPTEALAKVVAATPGPKVAG